MSIQIMHPLISSFLEHFKSHYTEHSRPPVLYHYTSLQSFLSILKNKQLWASERSLMNDRQEYIILSEFISSIFNKRCRGGVLNFGLPLDLLSSENQMDWYIQHALSKRFLPIETSQDHTFVFSMSSVPDLLSQWRAYASDGNGVCIGFDADYFSALTDENQFLRECFYFDSETEGNVSRVIGSIFSELDIPPRRIGILGSLNQKYPDTKINEDYNCDDDLTKYRIDLADQFINSLENLSFYVKNSAFAEEFEWRFIVKSNLLDPSIDFFAKQDKLHMFKKISFQDGMPIQEIVIGPGRNSVRNEFVIKNFLRNIGMGHIEIIKSEIPYSN